MSYFSQAKPDRIAAQYPLGAAFVELAHTLTTDALRALQSKRLDQVLDRAWQVPFYRKRFQASGLAREDIRTLDDLPRLPAYTKRDLMTSVAENPPWGDFHGIDAPGVNVVFHTTSGTTGTPQPLYYGAYDREVQNALLARVYLMHGLRDDDVVHSVYGFGTVNGGHYVREAMLHFTSARLVSAGTGVETPSAQQVSLMKHFGATALVGFGDYLARLAEVATQIGIEPGRDIPLRLISGHIDHARRDDLERAWGGAKAYDWYGVGDTGVIAAEAEDRDGLYLFEDAHIVEVVDPHTGEPVADGAPGNLCVTVLFKDGVYPVLRFDTQDVVRRLPGRGAALPAFGRIRGFEGRSDNMVKLRGINVYPTAMASWLASLPGFTGEYVCRVQRRGGRDEMTVVAECSDSEQNQSSARARLAQTLHARLGVTVDVELVPPGQTRELTGIERRQKPIRLLDER